MVSSATADPPSYRSEGLTSGHWTDYLMGVVRQLKHSASAPAGACLAVVSDVEPGAGLSSSAALTVAGAAALARLAEHDLAAEALVDVAFRAEHDYVGVHCGRMDQTIVTHAAEGTAMLFDTASGARVTAPFPYEVWIVPTGLKHTLTDGGYNARRRECEDALQRCREHWPDLRFLAALDPSLLSEATALLPAPLDRRVRHVVTEADRTRLAVRALRSGDLMEMGRLLVAGHESLRVNFESSIGVADILVDQLVGLGAYGARLTGAGWGGSVVVLAPEQAGADIVEGARTACAERFGVLPAAWRTRASSGVRVDFAA